MAPDPEPRQCPTIPAMPDLPEHERLFAARKVAALERLVHDHGVGRADAIAWLESWEGGSADMHDLRRDPTFWEQGYRYAMGEHERGNRPPPPADISSDERDPAL